LNLISRGKLDGRTEACDCGKLKLLASAHM
jgi:hypothetical protein